MSIFAWSCAAHASQCASNVASSIGISVVIAQLTSGTREAHAILVEHVTPFNNALQMPNVTGLIDMTTTTICHS